ncbi:uncharacterized protein LOC144648745 [Oculina patagonica]
MSFFQINIFDYNKIFIPIHLPGHWALGVVDLCLKTITYWDSLHTSVDDAFFGDVRCFLKEEGARRGQVFQQEDWSNQIAKDIPHQQNDYDCGMVLCMFAESLSRGDAPRFQQASFLLWKVQA